MSIETARPPIEAQIVTDRLAQTASQLRLRGADGIILFRASNILGFCGVPLAPSDRLICGMINRDRQIALVVPAFEAGMAESLPSGGELVCWQEHEDPYAAAARAAEQLGISRSLILLDGQMWMETRERLRAALPSASLAMDTGLIESVRIRKSPLEVDAIRMACDDAGRIYTIVAGLLREGRSEREIYSDALAELRAEGITASGALIQSGENAAVPHSHSNGRRVRGGDTVVVDFVASHAGYQGDMTRTFAVGRCSDEIRQAYAVVRAAQQAAINFLRPGVTCEAVDAAARRVIEAAGLGEYFTHRLGHGIGLDGHEPPYLVRGAKQVLEPGMCVTIEPGVYVPGAFGIRIEDTLVVTEGGCEVLSSSVPTDVSNFD